MKNADDLLRSVLREIKPVPVGLSEAVASAAARVWPSSDDGALRVGSFRNGVLNLHVDSHARLAEARTFFSEELRGRINEHLESSPAKRPGYVSKLVFKLSGT